MFLRSKSQGRARTPPAHVNCVRTCPRLRSPKLLSTVSERSTRSSMSRESTTQSCSTRFFHGSNPAASLWRHSTRRPKNHIWKKTGLERQCTGAAMVPTPKENWLHKSDLRLNRTVSRYRTILRLLEKKKYTSGSWPESPVRYHPPTHGRYKIRSQLPIDCQRPASNQIQKPKNR